ncbi:disulfide bond formation protein B [Croceicoccus sp. BE223]|uniref:disulfide bond formation protein B n=1 Tax=Croceicoccus sp. BE223 TaxID=2817716 RepID=UPI00285DCA6E|nr:disulfide bond formation protein B [Croceicoccus sp. BE223]MDR7102216.1 disulfide bond formation protein DsbB [Croceicoccus sp. BE223]
MTDRLSTARLVALIVPAALLAGAYFFEYGMGLYPCEMCWWQRYAHFAALVPAVLAFVVPLGPLRIGLVRLAALGILVSGLIGGFHAGVEYGWWEGFTQCTGLTIAEGQSALDAIMGAPTVRCDEVQWSLFGISMAGWNFLISTAAAIVILALSRRRAAPGGLSRVG